MSDSRRDLPQPIGAKTATRARRAVAVRTAGGRWATWALRTLVWAVLVGAALLLVRQALAPPTTQVVDAAVDERLEGQSADWPVDHARAIAARAATRALTLEEPTAGADGPPLTQTVEALVPGAVDTIDDEHATVELGVQVATMVDDPERPEALRHWRWVAVPVTHDGERIVAGEPVEMPPPADVERPIPDVDVDTALSDETRELADALFAAWAGESRAALDALTDGSVSPLSGDVELVEVHTWRVAEPPRRGVNTGRPDHLDAQAEVTWQRPGGAHARQTYAVHLERDAADRWRVTDLGPAHPTEQER